MRLFSIIQWHHFAYLVIALALLGYGISGSLLFLRQQSVLRYYQQIYGISILLFAMSTLGGFLLAQSISFNIEELFWDPEQILNLVLVFLILALPFTFGASAICMTFMSFQTSHVSKIYAVDLFGAGFGAIATLIVMYYMMPEKILIAISLMGITASAIAVWETKPKYKKTMIIVILGVASALMLFSPEVSLNYSPYKELAQTLRIKGARIIDQRASPLGHLTLVANSEVPFRHAPGLSLANTIEPPVQLGLFVDADSMSAITRYPDTLESLSYLDQTTSALAYHLQSPSNLLIIGSGTGVDLLQANYHHAPSIDALELNPQIIELINNDYSDFAGPVYNNHHTTVYIKEARDFLVESRKQYDLIQIALTDGASASSSGLYALNESYLYTLEAMHLYLSHLRPDGYLSITRWIKLPPRDNLKLFATAYQVLESLQLKDIDKRLLMIRNWQTSTLLVKNGLFTAPELERTASFCHQRLFDQAYHHQLQAGQSNRYNLLNEPTFFQVIQQIVSGKTDDLFDNYKFDLQPATDDRPYFHHFFKWKSFQEALKLRGSGGMPLIEWGYIVLLLSLVITALLSAILIIFPLLFLPQTTSGDDKPVFSATILSYFSLIGLAFLFIEIGTIQKFQLFLHHPIHAIAASLTAFLCFSGLGSYLSERFARGKAYRQIAVKAIIALCVISLGYLLLLPLLFDTFSHLSMAVKIAISILLIAPLAVCMGMPFPLAVASMKQSQSKLIPWAWGINGYASVISAGLATVIAIQFGFRVLLICAILLYLAALVVFPRQQDKLDIIR
jgi:spermidine synthase